MRAANTTGENTTPQKHDKRPHARSGGEHRYIPLKASGLVAPLPTWKDIPTTLRQSSFAVSSKPMISSNSAPNLLPSWQRALGSSARIRRTISMSGCKLLILCNSLLVSNVVRLQPVKELQQSSGGAALLSTTIWQTLRKPLTCSHAQTSTCIQCCCSTNYWQPRLFFWRRTDTQTYLTYLTQTLSKPREKLTTSQTR